MQKKILHLWDVPPLRYFPMPVHFVSSWTTGLFWTPVNIERQISVFLLFLLKFSVLTHFPKPSVVYTVSLIHWMFRFWASSSLLPGRIGKIMVYFVLASENWKLSDEERGKKACWLCVFWCVNPRLGRTTRGGCPPARPPPPPPLPTLSDEKTSAPAHFSNSQVIKPFWVKMYVFSTIFNTKSKTCEQNHAKCLFMCYFTCQVQKITISRDFNLISNSW